ncbi:MAG TPA: spermidine/putrescine ABC transporter substrate-binding protein [Actinomycetota bacterium]|jgi:spermidine/putrescine transport system substrate-binding protein
MSEGRSDLDRYLDGLRRKPLSRRRFLQVTGSAAAAAWLAACTKSVAPNRGGATAVPKGELEDELVVYNWTNYLNEDTIKAFEEEYGVTVRATDFYESNEELLAKIQGGARGYDVVAPTGYMVEIMAGENLLLKLDKPALTNLSNVQSQFLNLDFDPNNDFSVPKDWGTTGFMYLADRITEDLTSWDDFYSVASDYSGKYTVLDGAVEVVGSQLKRLGYSWNTTNQDEVDEATAELERFKPHVQAITSTEYRELMSRADAWIALGWNGDAFYILEEQESTKYVIPAEGTEYWVDCWCVLADAPHPNLAQEFVNWILTPERQAVESNFSYYASAVTGAKELTDEAVRSDPAIYPPENVTDKLEATAADPLILEQRTEAFTRFQAA